MSERVAIVAGAGGELGCATAQKLAVAGYTVAGVDRSEEGLKELPAGIRREAADPTDPAAARSVVDRIAAGAGPPEVLVNAVAPQLLDTAKNHAGGVILGRVDVIDSGGGPKAHGPASCIAPCPDRRTRIGPRAKVDITPTRGLERVRRA